MPKTLSFKSILFVTLQFGCLIFLVLNGSILTNRLLIGVATISFLLGLNALYTLRFSVTVFPDVKETQKLYTSGLYKYIRHPMYTAVLLFAAALAVSNISFVNIVIYMVLLLTLLTKMNYEEKLLTEHFSDYNAYKKSTKRLVPFLY